MITLLDIEEKKIARVENPDKSILLVFSNTDIKDNFFIAMTNRNKIFNKDGNIFFETNTKFDCHKYYDKNSIVYKVLKDMYKFEDVNESKYIDTYGQAIFKFGGESLLGEITLLKSNGFTDYEIVNRITMDNILNAFKILSESKSYENQCVHVVNSLIPGFNDNSNFSLLTNALKLAFAYEYISRLEESFTYSFDYNLANEYDVKNTNLISIYDLSLSVFLNALNKRFSELLDIVYSNDDYIIEKETLISFFKDKTKVMKG